MQRVKKVYSIPEELWHEIIGGFFFEGEGLKKFINPPNRSGEFGTI